MRKNDFEDMLRFYVDRHARLCHDIAEVETVINRRRVPREKHGRALTLAERVELACHPHAGGYHCRVCGLPYTEHMYRGTVSHFEQCQCESHAHEGHDADAD